MILTLLPRSILIAATAIGLSACAASPVLDGGTSVLIVHRSARRIVVLSGPAIA